MRRRPSTPFSRALALALAVGTGAVLYAALFEPLWISHRNFQQSRLQSAALLAKYQRLGGAVEALEAELAAVQTAQAAQAGFFPGESSSLAAAELQNHVKNIVRLAGEELKSTQVLPVQKEADAERVTIQVQLPLRIQSLQQVLHSLESGAPFVFIDNIDVRRRQVRLRGLQNKNEDVNLDVRFDLTGYMRPPAS